MFQECSSCNVCEVRGTTQVLPPALLYGNRAGRFLAIVDAIPEVAVVSESDEVAKLCGITTEEGVRWLNMLSTLADPKSSSILKGVLEIRIRFDAEFLLTREISLQIFVRSTQDISSIVETSSSAEK